MENFEKNQSENLILSESESSEAESGIVFYNALNSINKIEGDEDKETPEERKERITKEYIQRSLYINGKSAGELLASIEPKGGDNYEITFDQEFPLEEEKMSLEEKDKKINVTFKINVDINYVYEENQNSIYMKYISYEYGQDKLENGLDYGYIEVDEETHNQYNVTMNWNGKRVDFNIAYDDYETKRKIKEKIQSKNLGKTTNFDNVEKFENTQLGGLDEPMIIITDDEGKEKDIILGGKIEGLNPKLGREVIPDGEGYYRTLFYSANGKKKDIAKVYFTPDGEFNADKTKTQNKEFELLGVKINYEINDNCDFTIKDDSKKELEDKIENDRNILINILNGISVADYEVFSGLNKTKETFQFDSKIITLDPVSEIYKVYLNINTDKKLRSDKGVDVFSCEQEPLCCKVINNNIILVDEAGRTVDKVYFNQDIQYNYKGKKKIEKNYYQITKGGKGLIIQKLNDRHENPKENMPAYDKGSDVGATVLLKNAENLTNNEGGYLNYFDKRGVLISKMPFKQTPEGNYEFDNDKYHTKVEADKLYSYSGFKKITEEIDDLQISLGISKAKIKKLFEESLKNKNEGFDFNQKVVEITDPNTGESVYYNIDSNLKITRDMNLYDIAENSLNLIKNRLELAEKINNSKILWKNGKRYKDLEFFVGGETGIGKEIIAPEALNNFISGKTEEIVIKIGRGEGNSSEIKYTAKKDGGKEKLSTTLKSGDTKGEIEFYNQKCTIKTNEVGRQIVFAKKGKDETYKVQEGDIIVDPIEL